MQKRLLLVIATTMVLGAGSAAFADKTAENEKSLDEEATTPAGAVHVKERLAEEFGVQTSQVEDLRKQKMGYGEIHHALSLAKKMPGGLTQDNINSVMKMRKDEHLGWGQISHKLGSNEKHPGNGSAQETRPGGDKTGHSWGPGRGNSGSAGGHGHGHN